MIKTDNALYSCEQIRFCEQQATDVYQLDEMALMSRAGTEALYFILREYPKVRHIAIFCGSGNNAGDGYMLAKLAQEHGLSVIIYQCKTIQELSPIAQNAALMANAAGVECQPADEPLDIEVELIVDALLGIGLVGPVYGIIANVIQQINSSGLPIIALDIPSGLQADTGKVDNFCVKADATLTFIGLKAGMFTLDGPDYCGKIHLRHLQMDSCLTKLIPYAFVLQTTDLLFPLPRRLHNSHKGNYGHVLIIGGGPGMPGAVCLAAKAAYRAGAGLVSIATWPEHAQSITPFLPEALIWPIKNAKELAPLLAKASVCVIGPGLGECDWAQSLFLSAITCQLPMIIDASALRLLADHPLQDDNWVLTPHPGEAASLLACSTEDIQNDRFEAITKLQHQYGGTVILKGSGTLIRSEDTTFVCPKGNPGMASAGMGDVLTGIVAGLCAQGVSLPEAAKLGVWIHADIGDALATRIGAAGFLASDLLDLLPNFLHSC